MSVEPGNIALKRIYDDPADDDGCRVLAEYLAEPAETPSQV